MSTVTSAPLTTAQYGTTRVPLKDALRRTPVPLTAKPEFPSRAGSGVRLLQKALRGLLACQRAAWPRPSPGVILRCEGIRHVAKWSPDVPAALTPGRPPPPTPGHVPPPGPCTSISVLPTGPAVCVVGAIMSPTRCPRPDPRTCEYIPYVPTAALQCDEITHRDRRPIMPVAPLRSGQSQGP